MPKNLTLKGEVIEELMEAVSIQVNFVEDMEKILECINTNEEQDHKNDSIRNEAIAHLLKALEAYSMKSYEDVDRHVHAAVQKLHNQELLDLKDDRPRTEAKIKLSLIREKTVHNQEALVKLIDKIGGCKNACNNGAGKKA